MIKEIIPLDQVLRSWAACAPRKTFIKFEGRKFSYQDVDRLATVFASFLLSHGMKQET